MLGKFKSSTFAFVSILILKLPLFSCSQNDVALSADRQRLSLNSACELILDTRAPATDISIGQIIGRFSMLFCRADQCPSQELEYETSQYDMYVCRFKLIKTNNQFRLIPYNTTPEPIQSAICRKKIHDKENTPRDSIEHTTIPESSPSKRKPITPIKIVNQSVQKITALISSPLSPSYTSDSDSDDCATPKKKSKSSRKSGHRIKAKACRNLNSSLGNGLNYSSELLEDEMKIKLTISKQYR